MGELTYLGFKLDVYTKGTSVDTNLKSFPGKVSDGYHTFDELYEHRCMLFCALAQALRHYGPGPLLSWKSRYHDDGSGFPGWFLAGINLDSGTVSYHLPNSMWELFIGKEMEKAPKWDGHTAADVVKRLEASIAFREGWTDYEHPE